MDRKYKRLLACLVLVGTMYATFTWLNAEEINRFRTPVTSIEVTDTVATCTAIDKRGLTHGCVVMGSGDVTSFYWYGCRTAAGTFGRIRDDVDGSQLGAFSCAANEPIPIPVAAAGVNFIKIVAVTASQTGTFEADIQG
jgi:hypothetical protein